jgi:hypothetical protein
LGPALGQIGLPEEGDIIDPPGGILLANEAQFLLIQKRYLGNDPVDYGLDILLHQAPDEIVRYGLVRVGREHQPTGPQPLEQGDEGIKMASLVVAIVRKPVKADTGISLRARVIF